MIHFSCPQRTLKTPLDSKPITTPTSTGSRKRGRPATKKTPEKVIDSDSSDEEGAGNESDFEADSGVELNGSDKKKTTPAKGKGKVVKKVTTITTTKITKAKAVLKPRAKKASVPVKKEAVSKKEEGEKGDADEGDEDMNGDIAGIKDDIDGGEDVDESPATKRVKLFPNLKTPTKTDPTATATAATATKTVNAAEAATTAITTPAVDAASVPKPTNAKATPAPAAIVIDDDDKDTNATGEHSTNLKWKAAERRSPPLVARTR